MEKAPATSKNKPLNFPSPAAPRRAGGARRGGRARPALPRVPPQGGEDLMLVLPLDSLRRCECQPTPPMLWLRSDSRLVWHLLVGGCFLSLGGGWRAAVGGPQGMGEAPRGATMLPGEQRGRAGSLVFGSHAERGCCLGRLGDGGGRCQLHPPPSHRNRPSWFLRHPRAEAAGEGAAAAAWA